MLEKRVLLITLILAGFTLSFVQTSHPQTPAATGATWPSCGTPTKIALSEMEAGKLNKVPDKRALNPPCNAYYELEGMTILSVYTGDCGAVVSRYCDVHLKFKCAAASGCLFEIDQTWLAAGFQYPTGCSEGKGFNGLRVCVNPGDVVSAKGFFYIDGWGIHEFHPVASISVGSKTARVNIPPASPLIDY